jgi:2-keto-4-pentenoate hydratase/2-oxohepta-3-ene-1,7-dioic acid hydratase in catechol pathway
MPRITRYVTTEGARYGLVEDGMIYSLTSNPFGNAPLIKGELIGSANDILLEPPVQPTKIVCVGRNYAAHAAERNVPVPESPMLFLKPPSAMIAFDTPIILPLDIGRVEIEAELAVVIGKRARKVSEADALSYVFGYTCSNDVSARVLQDKDKQFGRAKGFDTFCPIGPWIDTDIKDPTNLRIQARLNGNTIIDGNTHDMIFSVPYLISFISNVMTLEVGDIIMTGTPAGTQPISEGDQIEIEIEAIGVLRNWVENEVPEE